MLSICPRCCPYVQDAVHMVYMGLDRFCKCTHVDGSCGHFLLYRTDRKDHPAHSTETSAQWTLGYLHREVLPGGRTPQQPSGDSLGVLQEMCNISLTQCPSTQTGSWLKCTRWASTAVLVSWALCVNKVSRIKLKWITCALLEMRTQFPSPVPAYSKKKKSFYVWKWQITQDNICMAYKERTCI